MKSWNVCINKCSTSWVNTLEKCLWQWLQLQIFLSMSVSALHIRIWGFSPILLFRFAQTLSCWMGSIGEQQSSSLSTDSQWDSSRGFLWATQGLSHSCSEAIQIVALAVCLGSLSCWNINLCHSPIYFTLWSRFSSRICLYFAPFIVLSILTNLPMPASENHPHSMMLPPPCFMVGMVLDGWRAVLTFHQT